MFSLKRGTIRYQVLVPSYTVTFAFFLVLTVGWLFVAERRHGTLVRLRAAPLARWQILLGKLIPCLVVSLFQGFFLASCRQACVRHGLGSAAGVAHSRRREPRPRPRSAWRCWLPRVAKTETQVRGLRYAARARPGRGQRVAHAARLDARSDEAGEPDHAARVGSRCLLNQLLINPIPQTDIVWTACAVLLGFGVALLLLAWWRLSLD